MNDETKVRAKNLSPLQARPRAAGGRALFSDFAIDEFLEFLIQLPDPDVILSASGINRSELRKLEGDDEIYASLESRLSAVLASPWRLEPGEGELVEFIWNELDAHLETIITGAWSAVPYGYAVQEVIYRREGNRILLTRVAEKPFEWFEPKRDGTLHYFPANRIAPPDGIVLDTEFKFLLTRRRPTYRNPYGQALLSRLYWPWFFRSKGWRFWGRFLERFGAPLLLGKTIGDQAALENFATRLEQAVQSAVAVVGLDDEVEAITPGNAGDSFERFERAINTRIQKVILGRAITSDLQKVGSNAAQKTDDRVREDRRDSDLRMLVPTVQQLVNALTQLNYPGAEPPEFIMEGPQGLELERAERDATLSKAGVRFTKDYLIRAYDFELEDVEIAPPQPSPMGFSKGERFFAPPDRRFQAGFAQGPSGRFTPGQEAVERLLEAALEDNPQPIDANSLRALIRASRDPEDLTERLVELAGHYEPRAFRELLEKSLFAADVLGFAHAESGD